MNYLETFKTYLQASQKASPATVKNYLADIRKFQNWIEEKTGESFAANMVTTAQIEEFKADMAKLSVNSAERYVSSLRKFYAYLEAEALVTVTPFTQAPALPVQDTYFLKGFKNSLYEGKASDVTIKNYLIDIKQFIDWMEEVTADKQSYIVSDKNIFSKLTTQMVEEYKKRLHHTAHLSPLSINRKLSSIRKYLSFLLTQGIITTVPFVINEREHEHEELALSSEANQVPSTPTETVKTEETPVFHGEKAYSSFGPLRLLQRLGHAGNFLFDLALILPLVKLIEQAQYLFVKLSGKGVFQATEAHIQGATIAGKTAVKVINGLEGVISSRAKQSSVRGIHHFVTKDKTTLADFGFRVSNLPKEMYAPISVKNLPFHKQVIHHLRFTRPDWYRKYHSYAITHYFHFAIMMIVVTALGVGVYNGVFNKAKQTPTLAALPTAPPRILSFQGRLTDNSDNPVTANSNLRFAIYSDPTASGGALLWQEVKTVSPDTDGIFNAYLGQGTAIPSTLFAQNASLYLGITVGTNDTELTPRQQIATVAYATNSETLQGLPPSTAAGAGQTNVVLALDSSGNLTIGGSATPTFQASGGQFTIAGTVVRLNTNAGTNSNIELAPDGTGKIDVQKAFVNSTLSSQLPTAAGAVNVDDLFAVNATSSGQSLVTLNQNGAAPIISASASGVAKFTLDASGTGSFAGNGFFAGNVGIGTTTTAARLDVVSAGLNTDVQRWMASDGSRLGRLTETSGGAGWFEVDNASGVAQALLRGDGGASYILSGNVGIGTSTPSRLFDVQGGTGIVGNFSGRVIGGDAVNSNEFATLGQITGGLGNLWQLNAGALSPSNPSNDVLIGGTATASALIKLGGTANASTFFNTGGNVGIGTTGPTATFDIRSSQTTLMQAYSSSTLRTTLNNLGIQQWYLNSGVGEAGSIAYSTPGGTPGVLFFNTSGTGRSQIRQSSATGGLGFGASTGSGNPGDQMVLDTNGNLGIGSTTPGYKLDVSNGSGIVAQFSGRVIGGNAVNSNEFATLGQLTNGAYWQRNLGALSPTNITDDILLGSTATASAKIRLGGTTNADSFFNTGGNVGIGTTTTNTKLTVGGGIQLDSGGGNTLSFKSASMDSNKYAGITFYNDANNGIVFRSGVFSGVNSKLYITPGDSATSVGLTLDATGNLGVGVTSPATKLQVNGNASIGYSAAPANGLTVSGNVGIGTSVPTAKLDVAGDASTSGSLVFRGGNTVDVLNGGTFIFQNSPGGDAGLTERLRIAQNGNIGIGTSNTAYGNLQVGNSAGAILALTTNGVAGSTVSPLTPTLRFQGYNNNTKAEIVAIDQTSNSNVSSLNFKVMDSSGSLLSRMYIDGANGNVGIGTSVPGYKLDVSGGSGIVGQFSGRVIGGNAVNSNEFVTLSQLTGGAYWQRNLGALSPSNITDDILLGSTATASAKIRLGGTTNADSFFNTGGNVGIGTTTPTSALSIYGSTKTFTMDSGTVIGGGPANYGLKIAANSTGQGIYTQRANGDYGGGWLQFVRANDLAFDAYLYARNTVYLGNTGTGGTAIAVPFSGDMLFNTGNGSSGGERMRITQNGYVGIGSTSPANVLTVNGATTGTSLVSFNQTTAAADIFTASASGTTRFVINNAGNVGIGSSIPAYKLDVNSGNISQAASFTSGSGSNLGNATLNVTQNGYDSGIKATVNTPSSARNANIYGIDVSNTSATLGTGGANDYEYAAGRFVMNQTATPSNAKNVFGIKSTVTANAANFTAYGGYFSATSTSGTAYGVYSAAGNNYFNGNVGIGSTSPAYKLDVSGGTGIVGQFSGRVIGGDAVNSNEFATLGQVTGSSYWQRNLGALSPTNISDDVLVGGTATASAKIRLGGTTNADSFFNTGGNVGIGTTTITDRLTVNGNTNLTTGNAYEINGASVLNATTLGTGVVTSSLTTVGALSSGSIASGFGTIATANTITGTTINGTTGINTGASAGTQRIDASGNLVNIGNITTTGTTGLSMSGIGAGITFSGTGNHDITASGGTLRFGAATLTGAITGGNQNISSIGNITANSSANTITGFGTVGTSGTTAFTGSTLALTGAATGATSYNGLVITANTGVITTGTWNGTAVGPTYGGTGLTSYTTGDLLYASATNTLAKRAIGTTGQVLSVSGGLPTWVDPATLSTNYWQRTLGALSPANITDDLLLGGTATASAKIRLGGTTNADSFFNTGGNVGIGTSNPSTGKLTVTDTNTGTSGFTAMSYNELFANPSGTTTQTYIGARNIAQMKSGNAQNATGASIIGLYNQAIQNGSNTVGNAYALQAHNELGSTGTITESNNLHISTKLAAAGTITTQRGIYIENPWNPGGGTLGTNYGIYVDNQTTGSTDYGVYIAGADTYGLYSGGGANYFAGNVGVGTTTIGSKFTLVDNTASNYALNLAQNNATGHGAYLWTNSNSSSVDSLLIQNSASANILAVKSNGNIGINTYAPTSFKLQVAGSVGPETTNTYDLGSSSKQWNNIYANNVYQNGALLTQYWQRNAGAVSPVNSSDDLLLGSTATASAKIKLGGTTNASTFFNTGGNVGIGTTNPQAKLDIFGGGVSVNAPAAASNINISYDGSNVVLGSAYQNLIISSGSQVVYYISPIDMANNTIYGDYYASGGNLTLESTSQATKGFVNIAPNGGNVGIGTSTPASTLDVIGPLGGNDVGAFRINPNSTGSGAGLNFVFDNLYGAGNYKSQFSFRSAGTEKYSFGVDANGTGDNNFFIYDAVGGSTRLAIQNDGNVGIGYNAGSIGDKLAVNGDINANGVVYAGNGGAFLSTSQLGTSSNAGTYQVGNFTTGGSLALYTNNNEAVRINTSGNVGIGTSTPLSGLHVTARTPVATIINQNGAVTNDIFTASASGTSRFVIRNDGNVGVGTTLPTEKMVVNGNISASLFKDFDNTAYYLDPANATTSLIANGNVGIGTTTASYKLNVQTATAGTAALRITDNVNYTLAAGYQASGVGYFGGNTGSQLALWANGSEKVRINASGNVGIGNTAPGSLVQIGTGATPALVGAGTVNILNATGAYLTAKSGTNPEVFLGSDTSTYGIVGTVSNHNLGFRANNTLQMTLTTGGNLGIGPTSPTAKLDVSGTVATGIRYLRSSADARITVGDNTKSWSMASGWSTGGDFSIIEEGVAGDRLSIKQGGNVGIGTGNAQAKLAVNGSLAGGAASTIFQSYGGSLGSGAGSEIKIGSFGANDGNVHSLSISLYRESTGSSWTNSGILLGNDVDASTRVNGGYMDLSANGNFGFGLINPAQKIDVSGSIRTNTYLYSNYLFSYSGVTTYTSELRPNGDNAYVVGSSGNRYSQAHAVNFYGAYNAGPDVAERYQSDDALNAGELVSWNGEKVKRAGTNDANDLAGVISSNPGITLSDRSGYDNSGYALALVGRVPVKVSSENGPVKAGDYLTISSTPGVAMKATQYSKVIGRALEDYTGLTESNGVYTHMIKPNTTPDPFVPTPTTNGTGKIMVFVQMGTNDPAAKLANTDALEIASIMGVYRVKNTLDNQLFTKIDVLASAVIGNLRAGAIDAQKITTGSFAVGSENVTIAGQSLKNYILSVVSGANLGGNNNGPELTVDNLKTNLISPLASESAVVLNGRVFIAGNPLSNKPSLEVSGNASISGKLSTGSLTTNDATISGTLRAGKIIADDIEGLNARIASLSANTVTASSAAITNITNITNVYNSASSSAQTASGSGQINPEYQNGISSLTSSSIQSAYANIATLSAAFGSVPNLSSDFGQFNQGLMSLGATSLSDTSVTGQLSVNGNMILAENTINVLGADLQIQPLRQGGVSFEGGLVAINTEGDLTVGGNAVFNRDVTIKGTLATNIISPVPGSDLIIRLGTDVADPSKDGIFQIQNASGSGVLAIDQKGNVTASGSGFFKGLASNIFNVVRGAQADTSVTETTASASAGTATIQKFYTERTIYSPYVSEKSLIYVTATSNTQGQTPYIARQTAEDPTSGTKGSFTIQIPTTVSQDIKINWWIVN